MKNGFQYLKKIAIISSDFVAICLSALFAFLYVNTNALDLPTLLWVLGGNLALSIAVFWAFGLYDVVFVSVGVTEFIKSVFAVFLIGVVDFIFILVTKQTIVTIAALFVYLLCVFCLICFIRSFKRIGLVCMHYLNNSQEIVRVMIVGGGAAGVALIKEMLNSDQMQYNPVCIIDDATEKQGKTIGGVKIVGTVQDISAMAQKYRVSEIFIAMPSVGKKRIGEIVQICKECQIPTKVLPGLYQFTSGQLTVSAFRQVDVQELLGREQVSVDLNEIMGYIEGKTVLVTGGGGSIGSELCRQIATHNPKLLIVLDVYENNAYDIEQELKRRHVNLNLLTLIASVRDEKKMRTVFETYRPQIVFHAAAHKHVPLMETSPNEAVKNNVFGTLNVARCADEFEVETFVQISTDKAVNPTNIMGATKRICEMMIQTIGRHSKKTKFVAVRFGNVLGSNGSVIPLFKKQIEEGGPVTVTHKDIIRYFMTIPEAVSLVLQAGAYAKAGQIFVLDMGEPVRIYDLAYNLIKYSGFEPNVDIDIVCTGLRPGEKLYEERLMKEEGLQKTPNGLINIARPIELDESKFWSQLDKLKIMVGQESEDMKELVKELVPTYTIDKKDKMKEILSKQNEESLKANA